MKSFFIETHADEKGLTLVEVLASAVILAMIVTMFLLVFSQSAKTTTESEQKIDGTYLAQQTMENMYELSEETTVSSRNAGLTDREFVSKGTQGDWAVFERYADEGYLIRVRFADAVFEDDVEIEMQRVIVEVFEEHDHSSPTAKMENLFTWEADE